MRERPGTPDNSGLAMAKIASVLQVESGEQLTVEAILRRAVEVVPDAEMASLTVRGRKRTWTTLGSSSDVALKADEAQYALREGPCVESAQNTEWLRSGDVLNDHRWPRWGREAAALGVVSLLSVSLYTETAQVGALNMYATEPGRFATREGIDIGVVFAVHAANALASARLVEGLESAVSSRHMIGAAQGILIERFGISLDQAFDLLRRLSSHENRKLADIARDIVETGRLPETKTGHRKR